jgi:hypothetical protein
MSWSGFKPFKLGTYVYTLGWDSLVQHAHNRCTVEHTHTSSSSRSLEGTPHDRAGLTVVSLVVLEVLLFMICQTQGYHDSDYLFSDLNIPWSTHALLSSEQLSPPAQACFIMRYLQIPHEHITRALTCSE